MQRVNPLYYALFFCPHCFYADVAEDFGKPLETELPAGRYELRVTSPRPNNRVPYTLKVTSDELLAGLSRVVTAPATVALSVGGGRLVEVGSYGSADVRAELRDRDGTLLAASDDRPWSGHATAPSGLTTLRAGSGWATATPPCTVRCLEGQ